MLVGGLFELLLTFIYVAISGHTPSGLSDNIGTESPGSMRRRSQSLFTRMKEAGYITQKVRSKCGICGG